MLDTSVAPPTTYMFLPGCCFNLRISSRSLTILVVFHSTLFRVLETTIWGCLVGEPRVSNFILRGNLTAERQNAGRIFHHSEPVFLIGGIQMRPRIDIGCCCSIPHPSWSFVERHRIGKID